MAPFEKNESSKDEKVTPPLHFEFEEMTDINFAKVEAKMLKLQEEIIDWYKEMKGTGLTEFEVKAYVEDFMQRNFSDKEMKILAKMEKFKGGMVLYDEYSESLTHGIAFGWEWKVREDGKIMGWTDYH